MLTLARQHPWRSLAVVLGPVAVIADATLDDWGNWAAIVAAVASVAIIVAGTVRWLWRKLRLRNPVHAYYVRPDRTWRDEWEVGGFSHHVLAITFRARMDIAIDSIEFGFEGRPANMPLDEGAAVGTEATYVHPARERGGQEIIRTNEFTYEDATTFPKYVPKLQTVSHIRRVTTRGEWTGNLHLQLAIRTPDGQASKLHEIRMPFRVLKSDFPPLGSPEAKAKLAEEREDAEP